MTIYVRYVVVCWALAFAVAFSIHDARADTILYDEGTAKLTAGAEVGVSYSKAGNVNFGFGIVDARTRKVRTPRATAVEGYLKPLITGEFATPRGTAYGRLSAVTTFSRGDGDLGGGTQGNEEDWDIEEVMAGWRSGDLFPGLGKDALDISVGAQDFKIGDGFLVYDGNTDAFGDAAAWLAPRNAFRQSAVARFNAKPVGGDLFYLKADKEHDSAALWGANGEYHQGDAFTVGVMYLDIVDAIDDLAVRDGLRTLDLRFHAKTIPGAPGFSLKGEYARQFGTGKTLEYDAVGWHLTGRYDYKFGDWPVFVRYRYARFSGDNPNTADRELFDPLFVGYSEYGDWYQGELMSQQALVNANQRHHMLHVGAWPREWLRFDLMYWQFDLDRKQFLGVNTAARHFADEVNLSAEVFLNETSSLGALASVAFPGDAARQSLGNNKPFWALEFFAIYNF